MPGTTSVLPPAIPWERETLYPGKPDIPTAAGTLTNLNDLTGNGTFGSGSSLTAYNPHVGIFVVGVNSRFSRHASGLWSLYTSQSDNASTCAFGRRVNAWCPFLNQATAPADGGDSASRIGWLQVCFLAQLDAVAGVADAIGFGLVPDDGLAFAPATWIPRDNGGFGIYKRVGTSEFRYVSYSAAPALLESIDLPSAAGWHTADFIFRQAVLGDATTPWLTVLWDNVALFSRRLLGHALLPHPQTIRATAHGWAFLIGGLLSSGELSSSYVFRSGARMPDGSPVLV